MRRVVRLTQLLLLSGAFLGQSVAHAALSAHLQRGEKIVDLPVAGRNAEVCVIPKHFVGGEYSDKDIEVETKLCNIDGNTNAAVCPKLSSTNPGLIFIRFLKVSPVTTSRRVARHQAPKRSPNISSARAAAIRLPS